MLQKKSTNRALRQVESEGLCSVSSNSKWQKILPTIKDYPCDKRIKWIHTVEPTKWQVAIGHPSPNYIEASGGPEQLKFVEWIEIKRGDLVHRGKLVQKELLDHSDRILITLDAEHATYDIMEDSIKIFGYTRSQRETKQQQNESSEGE